tara:strand:+ start:507 stop:608 length:102 start_codon:yes stop_codon:yes gene_type:complete
MYISMDLIASVDGYDMTLYDLVFAEYLAFVEHR